MTIGYFAIRNPWNTCVALDEFGPGTLDGSSSLGTRDACGPAALENVIANYEGRAPSYANIGAYRKQMLQAGQWAEVNGVLPAVSNPSTDGCYIDDVAWEATQLGLVIPKLLPYQPFVLNEATVRSVLDSRLASIWIVTNAASLAGNESGIHNHFVAIAGYGGDNPDGSSSKIYVLNSDILGQHGTATGQWMPIAEFLNAQPHGYAIIGPKPAPKPTLDAVGIRRQLGLIQTAGMTIDALLKQAGY